MLGEWLVEVAALGRLDTGGASTRAGALGNQAVRVGAELLEARERRPRDADAARVRVIDEDRRCARLRVVVGREASDVPAVAHRDQRRHRDLGVLERVQRPEQQLQRKLLLAGACVRLEPQRLRREARGGQLEGVQPEVGVVGKPLALVGEHGLRDAHLPEAHAQPERLTAVEQAHDRGLRGSLGLRVPVPAKRAHERASAL